MKLITHLKIYTPRLESMMYAGVKSSPLIMTIQVSFLEIRLEAITDKKLLLTRFYCQNCELKILREENIANKGFSSSQVVFSSHLLTFSCLTKVRCEVMYVSSAFVMEGCCSGRSWANRNHGNPHTTPNPPKT